jgi:hypothetical protein
MHIKNFGEIIFYFVIKFMIYVWEHIYYPRCLYSKVFKIVASSMLPRAILSISRAKQHQSHQSITIKMWSVFK